MPSLKEEHISPDNLLTLVVEPLDDGDALIGFAGFGWHTHPDILAVISGLSKQEATRQFVDSCCWAKGSS